MTPFWRVRAAAWLAIVVMAAGGCVLLPVGRGLPDEQPPGAGSGSGYGVTTIAAIQGAAHRSPLSGRTVEGVKGVVTAVKKEGFYLQSVDPDGDPRTSEGIFVRTATRPQVAVGDRVELAGRVAEEIPGGAETANLSITEIHDASIRVLSSGSALPAPVVIGALDRQVPTERIDSDGLRAFNPELDGIDFFESLEGMLVQVDHPVVVGPTNAYGEIAVIPGDQDGAGLRSARGGLVLRAEDANPERIFIDDAFLPVPQASVGDAFSGPVAGVMSYSFGNFKLEATQLSALVDGRLQQESAAPPGGDDLSIATYNLSNFGPGDSRTEEFARQIVVNLQSPDILALQEVQDNNGEHNDHETSASAVYEALISAILSAGGPRYEFREIAPADDQDGGLPGANIRTGFLFRTDRGLRFVDQEGADAFARARIDLAGRQVRLSLSPGRIEPDHAAFQNSRKPLAAEFEFRGKRIFVLNLHLTSKSGDQPLFGRFQPPFASSEEARLRQARVVRGFVGRLLAASPEALVVVAGDMNDFPFSKTVAELEKTGLVNLLDGLPEAEHYTYVHEGNSQSLDHILASPAMKAVLDTVDIVHINSEWPQSARASDHDPVLARFSFPAD